MRKFYSRIRLAGIRCAPFGMVLLLNACALAPGMTFSPEEPLNPTDPDSTPTIIPITLDSVRKNNESIVASSPIVNVDVNSLLTPAQPYRLGPGDVLSIIVWDHPELVLPSQTYNVGSTSIQLPNSGAGSSPSGYAVDSEGIVQFPYAGAIKVAGLTDSEVQALMVKRLSQFINKPQVTIRIAEYRSKRVYLDGEVRSPGVVPLSDVTLSIVDAINQAGGVLPTGDPTQITLARDGKTYTISIPGLLAAGINPSRLILKGNDLIRVVPREENKIFVMGEVTKPSTVTLRNGKLTLNEALGDAGGVSQLTSDPRQIYVIRYEQADATPVVFHLDGKSPVALALAENFQLKRKDVVYVDSAPIVRWNRFVSNLLPGLNTTFLGASAAK